MAKSALQPIIYQLQEGLKNNGLFDTNNLGGITERFAFPGITDGFGPEVIVLVSLLVVGFFFIVDVLTGGVGRSLSVSSEELWQVYKDKYAFNDAEQGRHTLAALDAAAKLWGDPEDRNDVQNISLS
ncbi:uncharacterized protein [Palaemon carinicauda]|uniref:uncharacterized protein n=1 Tax=Palaemon carinicauda TaxID=392227 RepID=UPI0035B6448A